MRLIAILAIVSLLIVSIVAAQEPAFLYQSAQRQSCAISTGSGLLQDMDCDKVPDYVDNCDLYNPEQKDSNSDGLGDVCAEYYGVPVEDEATEAEKEAEAEKAAEEAAKEAAEDISSMIKIIEAQDIFIGGPGAVYPIKLTNTAENDQRFVFEVSGLDVGTYRVDPSSTILLAAGEEKTAYLHILADEGAEEISDNFVLKISSGDESQEIELVANILNEEEKKESVKWGVVIGWLIVIIVLIVLGVILLQEYEGGDRPRRERDEEIYSYY